MKRQIALLFSFLFLSACGGENVVDVINELPRGTIQGTVALTSNDTSRYALDGVKVSLDGTSLTAISDVSGKWKIDNVPSRTYNITFEKENFGYTKLFSFGFLGGVPITVPTQTLFKLPDCSPIFDNVIVLDSTQFQLNSHLPCGNELGTYYVAYFLSNKPNVSFEKGKHELSVMSGNSHTMPISVSINTLYFQPGYPYASSKLNLRDSIYAVAYSVGGYNPIVDPVTGEVTYPSLLPETSRRMVFKLPFNRR